MPGCKWLFLPSFPQIQMNHAQRPMVRPLKFQPWNHHLKGQLPTLDLKKENITAIQQMSISKARCQVG